MTRRERLERKLEKRREWAQGREAKARTLFDAAHKEVSVIPMGQPILVGHHSERAHRSLLKRADQKMRAGVESANMADHHEQKANGIERQLETSVFSDDPDAIEQLQTKIREAETLQERMKAANKLVRRFVKSSDRETVVFKDANGREAAKLSLMAEGFSEARAIDLLTPDFCGRVGFPSYALQNNNANIRRMQQRIEEIKRRNARAEKAEASGGVAIEGTGEYVRVTFAEKPEREVINALKAAGFHWGGGSWSGKRANLPDCVTNE